MVTQSCALALLLFTLRNFPMDEMCVLLCVPKNFRFKKDIKILVSARPAPLECGQYANDY